MKKVLFLVLLIKVLNSFSQTDTINYFPYFNRFIAIEDVIVKEDFNIADVMFDSLFCDYDPPFLSDVLIALQVSALVKNINHCRQLLSLSVKKGAQLDCLRQLEILNTLPVEVWKPIEANFNELHRQYLKKIDTLLLNQFCKRYEREQRLKNTDSGLFVINENVFFIKHILRTTGKYPGERLIGIDLPGLKNNCKCCYTSVVAAVTLYHYSYGFSDFEGYYLQALKFGYINPRQLAWLYIGERIARKERYFLYKDNPPIYWPDFPEYRFNFMFGYKTKNIERVNNDRAKFGICSYETDNKKKLIEKKYGITLFFYNY